MQIATMRNAFIVLAVALGIGGPAPAQHNHAGATPEAFTATPAFGPDGTLWLARAEATAFAGIVDGDPCLAECGAAIR